MQPSSEEMRTLAENIHGINDYTNTGQAFRGVLDAAVGRYKPDIAIIDPAFAYMGGDALKQAEVTAFMRGIINEIAKRHNVGILIVHHTNKPSVDRKAWVNGDLAYLGAGSAEWINPARCAIGLLGRHAPAGQPPHWVYADAEDVEAIKAAKGGAKKGRKERGGDPTDALLIAIRESGGSIHYSTALELIMSNCGIKERAATNRLNRIVEAGRIYKDSMGAYRACD